jgi:hypothetical protein
MIVAALAQALVAVLIGVVLVQRRQRVFGYVLIAIGAVIAVVALIGLARFSP